MWGIFSSFSGYDSAWKEVEKMTYEKPKTALEKVSEIEQRAKKEKNYPQELRAIFVRWQLRSQIEDDAFSKCLSELSDFKKSHSDKTISAMASYMESQCYASFFEENQWKINRRTQLADSIPADIEEWTANHFVQKIRSLRDEALKEPSIRTMLSADYEALVELHEDSRLYRPTLFDLLMHHAIDNAIVADNDIYSKEEVEEMWNQLLQFHEKDQDKHAFVKVKLDLLKHNAKKDAFLYVRELEQLLQQFDNDPSSILVRIELANVKRQKLDEPVFETTPADVLEICNTGIDKFPSHPEIGCLKDIIKLIHKKSLQVSLPSTPVHEGDPLKLTIRYANLESVKLSLYRYDVASAKEWFKETDVEKVKKTKVNDFTFDLPKSNYCIERDTVVELPAQPFGVYTLMEGKERLHFIVSNLYRIESGTDVGGKRMMFIVDSKNGQPKKDVEVAAYHTISYHDLGEPTTKASTDKTGAVEFPIVHDNKRHYYSFSEGKDLFFPIERENYIRKEDASSDNRGDYLSIFTDRSIYRPGQTVYFKCIQYHLGEKGSYAIETEKVHVVLRDANYQVIGEQDLVTNEFGSASSSFVLPANGLSGYFCIDATGSASSNQYIRVEEYKRPTFEVKLSRPKGTFSFGDTIHVKGKADYLLGAPVSDAKVSYKITRRSNPYFWWWSSGKPDAIVADGEVTSDDKGEYQIPFVAVKEPDVKGDVCYRYDVEVSVTDPNGETRSESTSFSVGDISLSIVCPTQERCLMDELSEVEFAVVSLNYERIQKEVSYSIYRGEELLLTNKVVSDAKTGFRIKEITKNWASGAYKIELTATDDHGRQEKRTFQTILYREDEKRPPVETPFWKEHDGVFAVEKGEKKLVRIGTSFKNAHLLMIQLDSKSVVKKQWFTLSDEIKTFELALDADAILETHFFLVQNGTMHTTKVRLERKVESHTLPLKLSVFRDKMQPGSEEKWTITVPAEKSAEVLAAMYDASLDQIQSYNWYFCPDYNKTYRQYHWTGVGPSPASLHYVEYFHTKTSPQWAYDILNAFQGNRHYGNGWGMPSPVGAKVMYCMQESAPMDGVAAGKSRKLMKGVDYSSDLTGALVSIEEQSLAVEEESMADNAAPQAPQSGEMPAQAPKVRTNFAETAFFFPHLNSDKQGNVQMTFTMPESLTRWKFMALAHTQDMYYNFLKKEVVTQKDLMISPNLPRFLRHGDACTLTAKIINLSDKNLQGTATLQFLDPTTEEVLQEKSASFAVEGQKNTAASWSVDIPRDVDAYIVRVSAICGDFSDAEQKLLPVLSDRVVLTQTMPLVVRGGKTKDYSFDNLLNNDSKTLHSRFLKLEMATNPIWYAVQSLPSVAVVEHENTISYSAAHFASTMAQLIAKSNPKIFRVIEQWKQQSADKQTLLSNLEKNQEVKNVLLNECPWVMDAKNETEMKQRLATLFDVNDLRNKCDLWLQKMNDLQNADGGYAWFKDMPSGHHTTLFVVDNFGRLREAGVDISGQKERIERAIRFLDQDLKEDYEMLKKYDKDYKKNAHVSTSHLYYFQVRSLFKEVSIKNECQEAYDFYYDLMKKQWLDFSLNGRALAAIGLYRNGDKDIAMRIIESLREFSTTKEDEGMFWQKNVSSYMWQDAAISTHTRIMEAFALVDPKQSEQDEMRIWLLNQKRTQNWDNVIANVDALNVLLLSGSDWLSKENEVTVKLGGQLMTPAETETGTGYYTIVVPGKDVKPEMGKVQLQSAEGGNISWGALYWQFEEDMEKVKSNKTGLHIEKMVMLEQVDGDKNVLKTINDKTRLKVGDKLIVRLTLRTDRDLDYVSLKDQRASCLEPLQQRSDYRCGEYTCYYQSAKDAAMYYFFSHLQKGTYVFEYPVWVTNQGEFSNGITTVQCLYAPEYSSNTGSVSIRVGE